MTPLLRRGVEQFIPACVAGLAMLGVCSACVLLLASRSQAEIELVNSSIKTGRLSFTYSENNDTDIYVIDFAKAQTRPLIASKERESNPRWSNDGKSLAFEAERSGSSTICSIDLTIEGFPETRLVTMPGAGLPDWSPDDAYLVFSALNKDKRGRSLFVVNTADSQIRRLYSSKRSVTVARWSPRGTEIVFSSNQAWPGWDLYLLELNTKKIQPLTKGIQNFSKPSWHPDGSEIIFSYGSAREFDLWKIQKGSSETALLVSLPGRVFDPEWIPGSNTILFVAEDSPGSGHYELFKHDFGNATTAQMTKSSGSIRNISYSQFPFPPKRLVEGEQDSKPEEDAVTR